MRPNKILIEISPDYRRIEVRKSEQLLVAIETVRDASSGYFVRSRQSTDWENELLDLAKDCPQLLHLHDALCRGEADWLPEVQDLLQWIAEADQGL